jgi:hypothetical protein
MLHRTIESKLTAFTIFDCGIFQKAADIDCVPTVLASAVVIVFELFESAVIALRLSNVLPGGRVLDEVAKLSFEKQLYAGVVDEGLGPWRRYVRFEELHGKS